MDSFKLVVGVTSLDFRILVWDLVVAFTSRDFHISVRDSSRLTSQEVPLRCSSTESC